MVTLAPARCSVIAAVNPRAPQPITAISRVPVFIAFSATYTGNRVKPALTPSPPPLTPGIYREFRTNDPDNSRPDSSPGTAGDSTPDTWKTHEIPAFTTSAGLYRSTFGRPQRHCASRPATL